MPKITQLNKLAASAALKQLLSNKKNAKSINVKRLEIIVELMEESGEANLKKVIEEAFDDSTDASNLMTKSFQDLHNKAAADQLELRIVRDRYKQKKLEDRTLWLEGDNIPINSLVKEVEQSIAQPDSIIENMATSEKHRFKLCICCANGEAKTEELAKAIKKHCSSFRDKNITLNIMHNILPGEDSLEAAQTCLESADLCLIFESPDFYSDKFMKKMLLENTIHVEQLLAKSFNLQFAPSIKDADRKIFDGIQSFSYNGKSYTKTPSTKKDDFVIALVSQLNSRLNEILEEGDYYCPKKNMDKFKLAKRKEYKEENYLESNALQITLQNIPDISNINHSEKAVSARKLLHEWEKNGDQSLFALLGQYGMGKTFTSRIYAKDLLERYPKETDYLPIYFDLRDLDYTVIEHGDYDIWKIISMILSKRNRADNKDLLTGEFVEKVWNNNSTLIIFDGLDEVTAHLKDAKRESDFLRELLKLVPDFQQRIKSNDNTIKRKMLLTCRTDYFKTIQEQAAYFSLSKRHHIDDKKDYDSAILLPLNNDQIKSYLKQVFPNRNHLEIFDFLKKIHNLLELSQRPLLLDFITEIIDKLEQRAKSNQPITTATIYDQLVDKSFLRDQEKHEIYTDVKLLVLEEIAAMLWNRSTKRIAFTKLQNFLSEYLNNGSAAMKKLYANKADETLYKDLRNATLLVRSNKEDFGFSHTSIQEYFLAKYLVRYLKKGDYNALNIKNINKETLDFVVDLLEEMDIDDLELVNQHFQKAMDSTSANCRKFIFDLYLKDQVGKQLLQKPDPLDASGLTLADYHLKGTQYKPIDLSGASLQSVTIENAKWQYVNLDKANLSDSVMSQTLWKNCSMNNAKLSRSTSYGAWRHLEASNIQADDAHLNYTKIYKSHWAPTTTPTTAPLLIDKKKKPSFPVAAQVKPGHFNVVRHCAIIDNNKALSCSDDGSLILWDLDNGKIIHHLIKHSRAVNHCAIIDNNKALSCSSDGSLILWDLDNGKIIHHLIKHTDWVRHCAIIDNNKALSCSDDGSLILWDLDNGKIIHHLIKHSRAVNHCAIIDNNKALSCSSDGSLILWDLDNGKIIHHLIKHSRAVNHCAIIDNNKALSCSSDGSLILWDLDNGKIIHHLIKHSRAVNHCAIIDNNKALSCSSDGSLILWDLDNGKIIHHLIKHTDWVRHCAIIDNNKALSCSDDGSLILWDLDNGKIIHHLIKHSRAVNHCAIIDNNKALSCSSDGSLILWDLDNGKIIHHLIKHSRAVNHCAIIDNNKALSCSSDGSLILWDLDNGKIIHHLIKHSRAVNHCAIIDNNKALSCSDDGSLILWDLDNGKIIHHLIKHSSLVRHCAIIDNNKALSCSYDGSLILWDLDNGKIIHHLIKHSRAVNHCAIIDNNKALSCSSDGSLILWDLDNGKIIHHLIKHTDWVRHCAIIDNNKALSCSYDGSLILWDLDNGKIIHHLIKHTDWVRHCAIIDNNKALSCSSDGSLILWDLDNGKIIHHLIKHSRAVNHCAIIDNNKALSCSDDGSLILWDLDNGKIIHHLIKHSSLVRHCAIIDNNKALSCSSDGSLILWDLDTGEALMQSHHLIRHNYASFKSEQLVASSDDVWDLLQWSGINEDGEKEVFFYEEFAE